MKLIAAIVYMCVSGVCTEQHVEIEQKACHIGTLHGKVMGRSIEVVDKKAA